MSRFCGGVVWRRGGVWRADLCCSLPWLLCHTVLYRAVLCRSVLCCAATLCFRAVCDMQARRMGEAAHIHPNFHLGCMLSLIVVFSSECQPAKDPFMQGLLDGNMGSQVERSHASRYSSFLSSVVTDQNKRFATTWTSAKATTFAGLFTVFIRGCSSHPRCVWMRSKRRCPTLQFASGCCFWDMS